MLTVIGVLVVLGIIALAVSIYGKIPLYISVGILFLIELIRLLPLGR